MEKHDKKPLVSVIMATYNEPESFIKSSIASILAQTYRNWELLIADDSTQPDTIRVINDFAEQDSRIRILRKNSRMGFVPALNYALDNAKGDLLARMDGDDVSYPDRIEKQVTFALHNPKIDLWGGSMKIMDEQGRIISERHYPCASSCIKRMFVFRSPFSHPTIMFRRSIITSGLRYDPQYKRAEDIDFYYRVYKAGFRFGNMPDFLLKYRTVGDQQHKRPHAQWVWNNRARFHNFIFRKPFFSAMALLVSCIYVCVPSSVVSLFYRKENSKYTA